MSPPADKGGPLLQSGCGSSKCIFNTAACTQVQQSKKQPLVRQSKQLQNSATSTCASLLSESRQTQPCGALYHARAYAGERCVCWHSLERKTSDNLPKIRVFFLLRNWRGWCGKPLLPPVTFERASSRTAVCGARHLDLADARCAARRAQSLFREMTCVGEAQTGGFCRSRLSANYDASMRLLIQSVRKDSTSLTINHSMPNHEYVIPYTGSAVLTPHGSSSVQCPAA